MGVFCDYTFRFEGDGKALARARELVSKIQADMAEYSGNGNCDFGFAPRPVPGGFDWSFYTTGGAEELIEEVERLAKEARLRVFYYVGSTDGRCECSLSVFEDGLWSELVYLDDAELGFNAALAYARALSSTADEADLETLRGRFALALSDGWDEDDWPWLLTARACAEAIFCGAERLPDWKGIGGMEKGLRRVRQDLLEIAGAEPDFLRGIDGLLALVVERKIDEISGGGSKETGSTTL